MCSWRGRFPRRIRCASSASAILSGTAELIAALHKIRDSYNVNGLGQIAAEATLDDLKYYRANFKKIIATREWLARELTKLGFRVFPSQTNFILAPAAAVSRARMAAQIARAENPRPLVQLSGSEKLSAHHDRHAGGSGGAGEGGAEDFGRMNRIANGKFSGSEACSRRDAENDRRDARATFLFPAGAISAKKPACIWNTTD